MRPKGMSATSSAWSSEVANLLHVRSAAENSSPGGFWSARIKYPIGDRGERSRGGGEEGDVEPETEGGEIREFGWEKHEEIVSGGAGGGVERASVM
ncbi:hypothetical protein FCM35_KLT21253 [Carex littledalei]|uniref:Uncharacterized protein n=1 Tax=Carex littledalei TaxID=544730 RepID=A0A833VVB0_9POAL|nr:hypothetical protein FCM35_KLT21253 [Carex littledalei]